ncbi:MAG: thymidine phosphorylase [Anaerovoracaceae bacterium]
MNIVDIIIKKRDGKILTKEEFDYVIEGYSNGEIPDYQIAALLMAIFFKGMTNEEIFRLTFAMKKSGSIIDLSHIKGTKVDKHSSGGVGDKTTLIVGPIAAAAGVKIAKMSGRGLGFTGGTIDKLESIPNFKAVLSEEEFQRQVEEIGIAIVGQSKDIAKADKLLYALRDVTGTVDYVGLIASSIMSKKLASGSDAIVLDVKYGSGAFMKTFDEARKLAEIMVEIGKADGKKTRAAITSMEEPLGHNVGNSLEVIEAIEVLKGNGPKDLIELSINLSGLMISASDEKISFEKAKEISMDMISSGKALAKFKEMIKWQNGDETVIYDYEKLPRGVFAREVHGEEGMVVTSIFTKKIGHSSQLLGAGREKKDDNIDLGAGIIVRKKVGDVLSQGDTLLGTLYTNDQSKFDVAENLFREAYSLEPKGSKIFKAKLIKEVL